MYAGSEGSVLSKPAKAIMPAMDCYSCFWMRTSVLVIRNEKRKRGGIGVYLRAWGGTGQNMVVLARALLQPRCAIRG
jgi:hypothetical protein